jgi:hypothetical protein
MALAADPVLARPACGIAASKFSVSNLCVDLVPVLARRERVAEAVPLRDLGVQPLLVAGQDVGGVCAADHDQLGGEWAEPFDLLHVLDGLAGVERTQQRPVQQPGERGFGDRPQVLTLRSGVVAAI